ncbi:hypothetical protein J7M23_01300 [Candidatus Sumerlaeota bacterium]|nr:hypothetical protein [Candidatus Sumerlaeota bacterium]
MPDIMTYTGLNYPDRKQLKGEVVEFRGILLDETIMTEKEILPALVSSVKSAHFNFVFLPFQLNGLTLYESSVAEKYRIPPIQPRFRKLPILKEILEIVQRDVLIGTSFELFSFREENQSGKKRPALWRYYKEWAMRAPDDKRIPIPDEKKDVNRYWLCPSNKSYRRFTSELLAEMIERFPLSAVILDFSVLTELPEICFCKSCRARLNTFASEGSLNNWKDFPDKNAIKLQWLKWMHKEILEFLGYLKARLHSQRPELLLMFKIPRTSTQPGHYSRPLPWMYCWEKLLIDVLLLNDYAANAPDCINQISEDTQRLPFERLYLPVVTSTRFQNLLEIITSAQQLPLNGILVKYTRHLLLAELEELGNIVFTDRAFPGEVSPLFGCKMLAEKIERELLEPEELKRFFTDFLRVLDNSSLSGMSRWLRSTLTNLEVFDTKIRNGEILIKATNETAIKNNIRRMCSLLGYFIEKNY